MSNSILRIGTPDVTCRPAGQIAAVGLYLLILEMSARSMTLIHYTLTAYRYGNDIGRNQSFN